MADQIAMRGQIWEARDDGRRVRVIHVTTTHAVCGPEHPKPRGRATRIRLDRLPKAFRLTGEDHHG
jgi:hypothetical protein